MKVFGLLEVATAFRRHTLVAVCSGGSKSDSSLFTSNRQKLQVLILLDGFWDLRSASLGKLKSLYEYPLGKHIISSIRESVSCICSLRVERYVSLDRSHKANAFGRPRQSHTASSAAAFVDGVRSEI